MQLAVTAGSIIAGSVIVLLMQCALQVRAGIFNLFRMPAIACLLFHQWQRRIFNINQLIPADVTPSLTYVRETAHTFMNHPACETPGWQFIAESGFEPRLESSEGNVCNLSGILPALVGVWIVQKYTSFWSQKKIEIVQRQRNHRHTATQYSFRCVVRPGDTMT